MDVIEDLKLGGQYCKNDQKRLQLIHLLVTFGGDLTKECKINYAYRRVFNFNDGPRAEKTTPLDFVKDSIVTDLLCYLNPTIDLDSYDDLPL